MILAKGLNDIAIERMKYMLTHIVHPEMTEKGFELYFGDVEYDNEKLSDDGSMTFIFHNENDESMEWSVSMKLYYEQCLACDLDPRMKVEGIMNIDEGWIARQLKKGTV